jgi:hypothetical protein
MHSVTFSTIHDGASVCFSVAGDCLEVIWPQAEDVDRDAAVRVRPESEGVRRRCRVMRLLAPPA